MWEHVEERFEVVKAVVLRIVPLNEPASRCSATFGVSVKYLQSMKYYVVECPQTHSGW